MGMSRGPIMLFDQIPTCLRYQLFGISRVNFILITLLQWIFTLLIYQIPVDTRRPSNVKKTSFWRLNIKTTYFLHWLVVLCVCVSIITAGERFICIFSAYENSPPLWWAADILTLLMLKGNIFLVFNLDINCDRLSVSLKGICKSVRIFLKIERSIVAISFLRGFFCGLLFLLPDFY